VIEIQVSAQMRLSQLQPQIAPELFKLVDKNRAHLKTFLPWLDKNTIESDSLFFINLCIENQKTTGNITFGIFLENKLIGLINYHYVDKTNKAAPMGYWMDIDHCGKGYITQAALALIEYGFKQLNLNRIEIRCAVENIASNSVAKKLNFKFEGQLRQAEWLYNKYVDHNIYSLLKSD
jgi:ribosomal-protein-serine acetyltransferase